MGLQFPTMPDGRSIHAEAFDLAMKEIVATDPKVVNDDRMAEEIVLAITDLVSAGQIDPVALARYAVDNARKISFELSREQ
jgi:hypothetical protein